MQATEILIQKFWAKTISRSELLELQQLLERDDSMREALGVDFFNALTKSQSTELPVNSERILQALHRQIEASRSVDVPKKAIIHRMWWAAAASVIIAVSVFMFTMNNKGDKEVTAITANKVKAVEKIITNVTDTVQAILLKDGSLVNLYPNSTLSFTEPFVNERRDIVLAGMAFFKVAKDAHRPFTVFSNGFATTALGTAFTVDTKVKGIVSVKLFEGKVVIRKTGNESNKWKEQYLLPNQEFVYNELPKRFTISTIDAHIATVAKHRRTTEQLKPAPVRTQKPLSFNNEAMAIIFEKLATHYHVKLVFSEADIAGLYFTGTFTGKEDLKSVLAIICNLNELNFTDAGDNKIEISKPK
ncbi:MAG: FecR family protein [Filimonas sp.]|nr:FecR family protein [Filimonas sp.]